MRKRIISLLVALQMWSAPVIFPQAADINSYDWYLTWEDTDMTRGDDVNGAFSHPTASRQLRADCTYPQNQVPEGAKTIAAVYDKSGRLQSCSMNDIENSKASCSISVPENEDYTYKLFLWDDMKPLSNEISLSSADVLALARYSVPKAEESTNYFRRATAETDSYSMYKANQSTGLQIKRIYNPDIANSGDYCMQVTGRTASWTTLQALADDVPRDSVVTVSCYVRNYSSKQNASYCIQGVINTSGGKKYPSGSWTTVIGSQWKKLTMQVDLSQYSNLTEDPYFQITNGENVAYDFYVDDFTITANKPGEHIDDAVVASVSPLSVSEPYVIRQVFENRNFGMITRQNTAEFCLTDEITPMSGSKSLKVYGRNQSGGTLMVYLQDIDYSAKVHVSVWLRNKSGEPFRYYLWQAMVPTDSGNKWPAISSLQICTDDGWHRLEGDLDLSQYNVTGTPMIQIVATSGQQYFDFYADDLIITATGGTKVYDDTTLEPTEVYSTKEGDSATAIETAPEYTDIEEAIPSLRDVYKDYFKVGATVWNWMENSETRYGRLLSKHFNSIVSNGEFHPTSVISSDGTYSYAGVDHFMDWAFKNGFTDVAGHALIWDRPSMTRFIKNSDGSYKSRDTVLAWMKEWITNMMKHCEGDGNASEYSSGTDYTNWHIDTWDVVNEAVDDLNADGTCKYRDYRLFINAVGEDYVDYAFKYADEVGYNDISLRYNDYHDYDDGHPNKAKGIYVLVKHLRDSGLRVDKVGIQTHFLSDTVEFNAYRDALNRYISTGAHVDITELDVRAYTIPELGAKSMMFENGITNSRERNQVKVYGELFTIFKEYKDSIDRVNFWTFWDGISCWNNESYTHKEYAGIFDRNYKAKPSYWAIVDPDAYYNKLGVTGSWDFEDGTGVAAVHDYSTENDPMNWTFGTARWNNGQTFYESAYPVIKNVSEATAATMPDFADWVVDSNYANRGGTDYAAPGSSKCMEFTVNSEQWGQNIAAIRVLLSKDELQPGKKYKISMYTKNSVGTRAIYSTLKAPWMPYYNSGDNYFDDSTQTANIPWAHYTSASPVAYSNCYWTPYEFVVEPKDEDFNAGYTNLWLAYTREFNAEQMCPGGVNSAGISYSMDKFWIDDFKITEYKEEHPLEWSFENAGDDIGTGSELGKWVSATSTNTGNAATSRMLPIVQSDIIDGTANANSTGAATNSIKCLKLSTGDQWCEKIGVKVKVSKDQLVPGKKYNLSMYAVAEASHQYANPYNAIYASLQPTTTTSNLGLYYEKNGSIIPGVFTGRSNGNATGRQTGFGVVRPYWYKSETTLNPQDSDFDKNGYAYLWLTFTHSDFYNKEGQDKKITPNHDIYLDDISITEVTATN